MDDMEAVFNCDIPRIANIAFVVSGETGRAKEPVDMRLLNKGDKSI